MEQLEMETNATGSQDQPDSPAMEQAYEKIKRSVESKSTKKRSTKAAAKQETMPMVKKYIVHYNYFTENYSWKCSLVFEAPAMIDNMELHDKAHKAILDKGIKSKVEIMYISEAK